AIVVRPVAQILPTGLVAAARPFGLVLGLLARRIAVVAAVFALLLQPVGRVLARGASHRHLPRTEVEIAVLAGSLSLGLIGGAIVAANQLVSQRPAEIVA